MSKGDIYTPSESRVSDVGFASARRAYEPSGSGSLPSARMSHINDSMRRENATLNRTIRTTSPSPIAFILDDTGSMGDWVDTIYEKMPMFYGQTILQGYLDKPAISFCLTGDAYYDSAPLQVTDFAEGDTIDKKIESLYIERHGGNTPNETYELAAYYYLRNCELVGAVKPFCFFTVDEGYYPQLSAGHVKSVIGTDLQGGSNSLDIFRQLAQKFECFAIRKDCSRSWGSDYESEANSMWVNAFGQPRVMMLQDPKAIIDTMLGAIALTVGKETLDTYSTTMSSRGQTARRVSDVTRALSPLSESMKAIPGGFSGMDFSAHRSSRRR